MLCKLNGVISLTWSTLEDAKTFGVRGKKSYHIHLENEKIIIIIDSNYKSHLVSWFRVAVLKFSEQRLFRVWYKVCFCSGWHTHFSVMPPNKMCPCCGVTTVNEYQTFIYTWARVWYSRGHCGSLANLLLPSLKLRGVVFLFSFFSNPKIPVMKVREIIFHNINCQKANDPWLLPEW